MSGFSQAGSVLVAIKLLHTAIWAFFVACILGVPVTASMRHYRWAVILSALVLVECTTLALNHGRCPLTDVAGRYTANRADNFDIYLPEWLARYNKTIFGALFVAGEIVFLRQWMSRER